MRREGDFFTEHGPRIYGTSYINTIALLHGLGIEWNDYFVNYNFQFLSTGASQILGKLTLREILWFVAEFLKFSTGFVEESTIEEWMVKRSFKKRVYACD